MARSAERSRPAFHGQAPSISTSSEKLSTILISTKSQNPDAPQRLVHEDGPDDVSDDQHLEAKQDHPAEIGAQLPERIRCVRGSLLRVAAEGDEPADDHDCGAEALDDLDHVAGDTLVAHPANVAKAAARGQTNSADTEQASRCYPTA